MEVGVGQPGDDVSSQRTGDLLGEKRMEPGTDP